MAWLVRDGEVLASVELADGRAARRRGLLGREDFDGVLRLKARSVHTVGMRFGIDAAFCETDGTVRRVVTVQPWRVTRPQLRPTIVFEARQGTFREWNLRPGDHLEVR
ncbi:MAG: DUF192 domain-containing protein [Microthrixaceae bacterium]|nr:DUF192 domain-containing protein [Microthrixaceae bacterium]MCB9387085.1 DUF192 domain-containing protein [Microthrixaceae bacterium]MCO5321617.1 DUF192 domain-containing protein [Microthrixaceae bacterium]